MSRRSIVSTIAVLFLLVGFSPLERAQTDQNVANAQKAGGKDIAEGRPVMWVEPVDLETRDLFYGIGGQKGEPDPSAKYRFIERKTSGNSEKIVVEDNRDRRW